MKSWDVRSWPGSLRRDGAVWLIAALTGLLHLAVAGRYDMFRNELYFIVCGRHPAFGYVDQPPLVPLLAAATQVFGVSTWALRLPAVFAATALIPLTAAFARMLGSGPRAAVAAAAAVALAPGLAGLTATFTTSSFEPLAWTAAAALISGAVLRDERRLLVWAGVVIGLSMEAKYGIGLWLIGLFGGVVATPARRCLAWRETWAGGLIAVALAAPSLVWQTMHGWPFFEVNFAPAVAGAPFLGTPVHFALSQAIELNPLLAPLWLTGLVAPFVMKRLKWVRFLAIASVIAAVIDYAAGGKGYYLYPAYPTLFALGGAAYSGIGRRVAATWLTAAMVLFVGMAPVVLPILDPPALERYLGRTHLRPRPIEAASVGAPLTQVFSDELGWRRLEQNVAEVYRALPEQDRQRAAIIASNYGEAAALDVYGPSDGLPPALSGNNQYFLWGPRGFDGSVVIHIGGDIQRWRGICRDVSEDATFGAPYVMPYESGRPIFVCRGMRVGLAVAWPRFKRYQ